MKVIFKNLLGLSIMFCIVGTLNAQELIKNGSFESFSECPEEGGSVSTPAYHSVDLADFWETTEDGSSDLWACGGSSGNYDFNLAPRTGNAHGGFVAGKSNNAAGLYREFIEQKINVQIPGEYEVNFFVRRNLDVDPQDIEIAMWIFEEPHTNTLGNIYDNVFDGTQIPQPQVSQVVPATTNDVYVHISGTVNFSSAGEYYCVIGAANTNNLISRNYFFVDDVSISCANPVNEAQLTLGADTIIETGDVVELSPSLIDSTINYEWYISSPITTFITNTVPLNVSPNTSTVYTLVATNSFGCIASDNILITVDDICCPQTKRYELTSDLPIETHVDNFIVAGFDAGITGIQGDVIVQNGDDVKFYAGNDVILTPGFIVESGGEFQAIIEDCHASNYSGLGPPTLDWYSTVFSPNGDGINDFFCVETTDAQTYSITVHDLGSVGSVALYHNSGIIESDMFCPWSWECNQLASNCPNGNIVPNGVGAYNGSVLSAYDVELTLTNCNGTVEYDFMIETISPPSDPGFRIHKNTIDSYETKGIETALNNFSIYPNPTSGQFTINIIGEEVIKEIVVTDVFGKTVYSENNIEQSNYNNSIHLNKYKKGIYFVRVQFNNKTEVRKVVFQ